MVAFLSRGNNLVVKSGVFVIQKHCETFCNVLLFINKLDVVKNERTN